MPLPIPILGAGALAAYFIYDQLQANESRKALVASVKPQVPPVLNQPGIPRKEIAVVSEQAKAQGQPTPPAAVKAYTQEPVPRAVPAGKTPAGNPIISIVPTNPDTGKPTVTHVLTTQGLGRKEAHELYDYLMANPIKSSTQSAALTQAVREFQSAHNADPDGIKVAGQLTLTGLYDLATSAALACYTGNPIAPHVATPIVATVGNGPGTGAMTGSNLYAYLKTHKNVKTDAQLKSLVLAFQKAVNTDPKYPGPGLAATADGKKYPGMVLIKAKLSEDGAYGPKTADALAVVSFERIAP